LRDSLPWEAAEGPPEAPTPGSRSTSRSRQLQHCWCWWSRAQLRLWNPL